MASTARYLCVSFLSAASFIACTSQQPRVTQAPLPVETAAKLQYPTTLRGDVTDDYHGVRVADPYRWFEDLAAPDTRAWVSAQNALSQPYLEGLRQRAWLGNRLKQLWTYER